MKKVFYIIWWVTPIVFWLDIFAFLGIIPTPSGEKNYFLDDANFNTAIQRLDSLPLLFNDCSNLNGEMNQYKKSINNIYPSYFDYYRWPLDCNTLIDIECESSKNLICIYCFKSNGRYRKVNEDGLFIEQINVFRKFEQTVLIGLSYKSDTSLFQDGLNHAKRKFIEICLWWPLIALVSFLIYWECYGNPFARPEED
ncbi:MAG: hypothetical protein J6I72_05005 [Muribaculaceae bacterium]|nr:hypothetical protein [Muribaculaceae bacterium]